MSNWRLRDKNGEIISQALTLDKAAMLHEQHTGSKIELNTPAVQSAVTSEKTDKAA